jgi:hypothetical protein
MNICSVFIWLPKFPTFEMGPYKSKYPFCTFFLRGSILHFILLEYTYLPLLYNFARIHMNFSYKSLLYIYRLPPHRPAPADVTYRQIDQHLRASRTTRSTPICMWFAFSARWGDDSVGSLFVLRVIPHPSSRVSSSIIWRCDTLHPRWESGVLSSAIKKDWGYCPHSHGAHVVGRMTPGRVKRLERYEESGWLCSGWPRMGLAGI